MKKKKKMVWMLVAILSVTAVFGQATVQHRFDTVIHQLNNFWGTDGTVYGYIPPHTWYRFENEAAFRAGIGERFEGPYHAQVQSIIDDANRYLNDEIIISRYVSSGDPGVRLSSIQNDPDDAYIYLAMSDIQNIERGTGKQLSSPTYGDSSYQIIINGQTRNVQKDSSGIYRYTDTGEYLTLTELNKANEQGNLRKADGTATGISGDLFSPILTSAPSQTTREEGHQGGPRTGVPSTQQPTQPPSQPSSDVGKTETTLTGSLNGAQFSGQQLNDLMRYRGIEPSSNINLANGANYRITYEGGTYKIVDPDGVARDAGGAFNNYMDYRRTLSKREAQFDQTTYLYGMSNDDNIIRLWTNQDGANIQLQQDGFRLPENMHGQYQNFGDLAAYQKDNYISFDNHKGTRDDLLMMDNTDGSDRGQIWGHQNGNSFQLNFYNNDGQLRQMHGQNFQPSVSPDAMNNLRSYTTQQRGELDNTLSIIERYGFTTSGVHLNNAIINNKLGLSTEIVDHQSVQVGTAQMNFASITTAAQTITLPPIMGMPPGIQTQIPGSVAFIDMSQLTGDWQKTYTDGAALSAGLDHYAVMNIGGQNFLISNNKNSNTPTTMIPIDPANYGMMSNTQTISGVTGLNANAGYGRAGNTVFDLKANNGGGAALGQYTNLQGLSFIPQQFRGDNTLTWVDDKGRIWANIPAKDASGAQTNPYTFVGTQESYGNNVNRVTPAGGSAHYEYSPPGGGTPHEMTDVRYMFQGGAHVDSKGNFFLPPNENNPNGVALPDCEWNGGSDCTMSYGDTRMQVNCGANGCTANYHGLSRSFLGIGHYMSTMNGRPFNGEAWKEGDLMDTAQTNAQNSGAPCSQIGGNTWCYYDKDFEVFGQRFCELGGNIYACGSNTTVQSQFGQEYYDEMFGMTPAWSIWLTNIGEILNQWIQATSGYPALEGLLYDPAEEEKWIDFSSQEWGYLLYGIQGWSSQICQADNPVSDTDQLGFAFSADSMLGASAHIEAERTTFTNYSDERPDEMYLYKLSFSVSPGTCYLDFEVDAGSLFYKEYDHEEMINPEEDEDGNESVALQAAVGGRTMQPSVNEFIVNTTSARIDQVCINFKYMDPENCFGNDMGPGSHLCREVNDGDQYEEGWHEEQYGY